ncbi:MAG: DUF2188 domain-containing protein [Clostridiales bacterium]|nr:DUF2188 domain-containing protein [Clostridiales bacterium]
MSALDELFYITLGWTWVLEYASLIIIIAAALLLILLITFIIVAVRHSKNKKKIANLEAQLASGQNEQDSTDSGELRNQIRQELEPIIREQVEREYAMNHPVASDQSNDQSAQQIAQLNQVIREKEARIDELGAALNNANNAHHTDNNELYRTINDLNRSNKELQNDINILKAENAQLKSNATQAQQTQQRATATAATPEKKTTARVKKPDPIVQIANLDDDDEEEYDNEFGDETSAVKVTLKYDRTKMNWVIYRSDTTRAYRRLATKQEGLLVAKDLARRLHAQLVVHKKDGKFQKI